VFAGKILDYYKSHIKDKEHIRLKFFFKKDEPELLRIPWEFMLDGDNFLSALPSVSLLRVIEGIPDKKIEKIKGKIKMLAIVSSPLDLKLHQRLQIEREQMLILQAVDRAVAANRMEIEFEDEASLRNIQGRLEEDEYHIIHYTGHGEYSYQDDKGYLLLEDDSGNSREVDNETIAHLLAGYSSLRLVVLSGCQTAKTSGMEAFRDLSTPLLHKGIPAVISMQYSIADESAMNLAKKLYTEISEEIPIDIALTRARKELLLNERAGAVDFATPVLYTDNPDCLCIEDIQPQAEVEGFSLKSSPAKNIVITLEQLGTQFIGRRRELRRIKEDLLNRGKRAIILHGIGGIGKTVTATKAAVKLQDNFRGIYAFDCSGGLKIEEILVQLNGFLKRNGIDAFDIICNSDEPVEMKINYLAQILSQIKLLLIFDNFETLLCEEKKKWQLKDEDLKKGLKALVTQCKDGTCFIFTSRYTFDITDGRLLNILDEINLGELTEPEAIMVMNRFTDISREEFPIKSEIFQKIGGHPYTINVFASHARNKSVKEVLMDIADVTKEMVEFALLDMSYGMLSSRAKNLVQRISVFKKAFPYEALEWMMKGRGKFKKIDKEIEELIHWGLIIKIEDEQSEFYQVHTLVKDFIREKIDGEEWKKWLIKAAQFYENLAKNTKSLWDYLDARDLYFAAEDYNKAGEIVSIITEYLNRWGFIDLAKRLNEETVKTASELLKALAIHNLGIIFQNQGEYAKAKQRYYQSLRMYKEKKNKEGITRVIYQIGNIYYLQNKYKNAIKIYNHITKISEKLGLKLGVAAAFHQLGTIHYEQGEFELAMDSYQESLKIKMEQNDALGIALTLYHIGIIYHEQGNYEKARQNLVKSFKLYDKLGDKRSIINLYHLLGIIFYQQGNINDAVKFFITSLNISKKLGEKMGMSKTLHQLGVIYQSKGEFEKAISAYKKSIKIKEELNDKKGIANTYGQLGNIYYQKGDYHNALIHYHRIMKIYEELNNKRGKSFVLHQLGVVYQSQNEYQLALNKYNESLKIKNELNDKRGIALSLLQIGTVYYEKGDYNQAMTMYKQSMKIANQTKNIRCICLIFFQIGNIYYIQNQYEKAIDKYTQSLKIAEELGDKGGIASTLHQLGMIHQAQGEYEQAIEKYNQSLKIAEELGDKRHIASTLHQLGIIHQKQGDNDKAIDRYNQNLKIKEQFGDKRGIASTLHQMGMIHQAQGEYDKAIEKYEQSLKIAEELGDKEGISITLHQLGMIYQAQGEYEQAIEKYNESLKITEELGDKEGISITLHQLGMIHQAQGEYEQAIENYDKSMKIKEELGNKGGIARTLHQLGMIHQAQGEYDKAIEKYTKSLNIAEELGDKRGIAINLGQMGRIYEKRKELKEAIKNYSIALSIFEYLNSPYKETAKSDLMRIKDKIGKEAFEKYYNEAVEELKKEGKYNDE